MTAYYNEIDPYAAEWLRNLIKAGHIADGVVDTRSISDIEPYDLRDFTQCHFFAGIGVWSLALRLSGWSDDRPVWTGSCPCQPFSSAGRSGGFADERHLWPHWHHLIRECRPAIVFGEQVASKAVEPWVDLVHADLEALGYAFAGVPFPSAGVGAPHIRDRLFWLGHSHDERLEGLGGGHQAKGGRIGAIGPAAATSEPVRVADSIGQQPKRGLSFEGLEIGRSKPRARASRHGAVNWVGDTNSNPAGRVAGSACSTKDQVDGSSPRDDHRFGNAGDSIGGLADTVNSSGQSGESRAGERGFSPCNGSGEGCTTAGPTNGHWRNADWLLCRDGKWRPVEPGTFPLAHGAPARVGRLRAYGNAINAQAAAQFIGAYLDARAVEGLL